MRDRDVVVLGVRDCDPSLDEIRTAGMHVATAGEIAHWAGLGRLRERQHRRSNMVWTTPGSAVERLLEGINADFAAFAGEADELEPCARQHAVEPLGRRGKAQLRGILPCRVRQRYYLSCPRKRASSKL